MKNKCSAENQAGDTSKALGTRQRTRYVKSFKELSDDERDAISAMAEVIRRPCPGAPRQRMKFTLSSERAAAKSRRLMNEIKDAMKRRGLIF